MSHFRFVITKPKGMHKNRHRLSKCDHKKPYPYQTWSQNAAASRYSL